MLKTKRGSIRTPAFIPVHTFGGRFPIDEAIRHFLPRVSQGIMVSRFYAKEMGDFSLPVFVDSGGFAGALWDTKFEMRNGGASIVVNGEEVTPTSLIEEQEKKADVAFTLDLFIPPGTPIKEARARQAITMQNAIVALEEKRSRKMLLFASMQAWDRTSARSFAKMANEQGFDGIGLGGLVPRLGNMRIVREIVLGAKEGAPDLPIHAFGVGSPSALRLLFSLGVDTADSGSFARYALEKKYYLSLTNSYVKLSDLRGKMLPCNCPICRSNDAEYLLLENQQQNALLALHNLMGIEALARAICLTYEEVNAREQGRLDDFSCSLGGKIERDFT